MAAIYEECLIVCLSHRIQFYYFSILKHCKITFFWGGGLGAPSSFSAFHLALCKSTHAFLFAL